jgi:hypothetical protein
MSDTQQPLSNDTVPIQNQQRTEPPNKKRKLEDCIPHTDEQFTEASQHFEQSNTVKQCVQPVTNFTTTNFSPVEEFNFDNFADMDLKKGYQILLHNFNIMGNCMQVLMQQMQQYAFVIEVRPKTVTNNLEVRKRLCFNHTE